MRPVRHAWRASSMYDDILYSVEDPVATITLNRPDALNAWTDRMGKEVRHAVAAAEADPAVVGIIITGAGRAFCAGADMNTLSNIAEGSRPEGGQTTDWSAEPGDPGMGEDFESAYAYFMKVRKPIVAAINGACAGMAVPIALFCDLRFMAD